ncbi:MULTISPECIES: hypothetical protein [unclassified Nocardia]|uniref:hypothetical protein n=1 Tax=unclassified Nocardia TaxID=2637762 RepID=UPI00278BC9A3|nr:MULTISPECIES: hypothetical protein [unclassified Nocardia]
MNATEIQNLITSNTRDGIRIRGAARFEALSITAGDKLEYACKLAEYTEAVANGDADLANAVFQAAREWATNNAR